MQTKKLKALFAAIALLMGFTATAWAQTTTVTVDKSHGNLYRGGSINNTQFASEWKSSDNMLKFSCGDNNMQWNGTYLDARSGSKGGNATYTLAAIDADNYVITGFSLKLHSLTNDTQTWTINSQTYTSGSTTNEATVNVSGLEARQVTFANSGANNGTLLYEFTVTLKYAPQERVELDKKVVFNTPTDNVPYRIPAVAQAKNGDLIFVSDYRYSGQDIGMATNGKLDLRFRKRDKSGNWGNVETLQECITTAPFTAFGDPCIVCDRETGKVMVTSCSGNVSYPSGTHDNHQGWARWYSDDNGNSWSKPWVDQSEQVMNQVDQRTNVILASFFIGSGKISQSKTIKVGTHYRLYCASLTRVSPNGTKEGEQTMNFVWYSDNFGQTWKMLGTPNKNPIDGGNEPKADELPDGSVLISSRTGGGRIYNIWHYTNVEKGEGYWGSQTNSNQANGGTFGADCNGEILIVPVLNKATNEKTYLLLQSIPAASDRRNVGIYYKELTDLSKYRTAAELAPNDWTLFPISTTTSAYSTMCQMDNGHIAFFYEEDSKSGGYDMVFKEFDIEGITDGAYTYSELTSEEKDDYLSAGVDSYFTTHYTSDTNIQNLAAAYKATPSRENYEKLNAAIQETLTVVKGGEYIRLRNHNFGRYLNAEGSQVKSIAQNTSASTLWYVKDNGTGGLMLMNVGTGTFMGDILQSKAVALAADNTTIFDFEKLDNGCIAFRPVGGGGYQYGHIDAGNNLVGWEKGNTSTQWEITMETISPVEYSVSVTGLPEGITTGGLSYGGQIYGHGAKFMAAPGLEASLLTGAHISQYEPTISITGNVIKVDYQSNSVIKTLGDIQQGQTYTITSGGTRGTFTYSSTGLTAASTRNAADPNQQFLFVERNGLYYLYNVGAQAFIRVTGKNENNNRAVACEGVPANISLQFLESTHSSKATNPVVLSIDGHHVGISPAFTPKVITHYNDLNDEGNSLRIEVADAVLSQEQMAAVQAKMVPFQVGTAYTIKAVWGDANTAYYVYDNGTKAAAQTTLPADNSGLWTFTQEGYFQNQKNTAHYLKPNTGGQNGINVATTGYAFSYVEGLASGTYTLLDKDYTYAVKNDGTVGGGRYNDKRRVNTTNNEWTTDFIIETVSDPYQELQDKITEMFEHIYNGEVGYPDMEAEANQEAITDVFNYIISEQVDATNYEAAKAAYDAVINLTVVNKPVPGKAYTIAFRTKAGDKKWYVKDNTVTTTKEEATVFVCGTSNDSTHPYIFTTNDNKYLHYQGTTSAIGYEAEKCDFLCEPMVGKSNDYITATSEERFGTVYMIAKKRGSSGSPNKEGVLIIKEANHAWDNADCPFLNGTFTTALEIEEATYDYNHPTLVKPSEEDSEAFATVYLPFAMQMPEGVEAYAAIEKQEKEGQVSLKLELANAGDQPVAAGAYILYSQSEEEVKTPKTVIPAAATPDAIEDNKLIGSTANTDATELCSAELTGHNPYVLGLSGGQAVFCPYVGTVYPKGKAIWLAETNQVSAFSLDFDQIVEAIHTLKADAADQPIYDLQGRRLQSVQKGISISAGHKVLR
ncbi:MAG: hypothetical protein KBS75_08550 [Bacteroidales bacterium]|nr:hypothetical protein [Candidatus Equimonas faecalis]